MKPTPMGTCEKCGAPVFRDDGFNCVNPHCNHHTAPPTGPHARGMIAEATAPLTDVNKQMNDLHDEIERIETTPPQVTGGMEEPEWVGRLLKIFDEHWKERPDTPQLVSLFIHQLLATQNSHFIAEVEKMKIKLTLPYDGTIEDYLRSVGYNGALEVVITKLKVL